MTFVMEMAVLVDISASSRKVLVNVVATARHADLNTMCFEKGLIGLARILATSIRMMQETSSRLALCERHAKSLLNQRGVKGRSHRPTDNAPREQDRVPRPGTASPMP